MASNQSSQRPQNPRKRLLPIDPLAITESLGLQTFRKELRKSWSKEEDQKLLELVTRQLEKVVDIDNVDWEKVAKEVSLDGSKKEKNCRKRWSNCLDPALRKGKWTSDEDEQLVRAFEKFGASWLKVASEIEGRTEDQCAKRYKEVLDPKTKDRLKPWSKEEDLLLIEQVKNFGTKWRTVCNVFESRPSLTCRNRWRKLVTEVVRDKASPEIKQAVERITNGDTSVLDSLTKQQEELTKNYLDLDQETKRRFKRKRTETREVYSMQDRNRDNDGDHGDGDHDDVDVDVDVAKDTQIEWSYDLGSRNGAEAATAAAATEVMSIGVIKDRASVELLVAHAKSRDVKISINQHIHHHYARRKGHGREVVAKGGSPQGILDARDAVEPEQSMSRFKHFNYLPAKTDVPKLSSSSPGHIEIKQHQHHHHHHHHYHPPERSRSPSPTKNDLLSSNPRDANVASLLNTDSYNKNIEDEMSNSNPLTPLTQAVELLTNAGTHNTYASYPRSTNNKPPLVESGQNRKLNEEVNGGINFWDSVGVRTARETGKHTRQMYDHVDRASKQKESGLENVSHYHANAANGFRNATTRIPDGHQSQNQHQHQHQPTTNFNGYQRGTNTLQYDVQRSSNNNNSNNNSRKNKAAQSQEDWDEEDEVLAREVGEAGVDQDILDSYGLFYNVYTKEGSTFPDFQPNQQPYSHVEDQNQVKESVYDQWGSGFIIPFNPS
ncbi:uncharacterized protein LODBEIA_P52460 [Lodderomyces beijingensis]|uniref:Uncharacterized protein n=1 Tax=Lodderomyces beijingensis TaxID=1775926 RepID=A0ABP0ZSD4_9ASCO